MTLAEVERAPQYMNALSRANEVRLARAVVKDRLKRGEIKLSAALQDPNVQDMKLFDLLCYVPAHGPSKVKTRSGAHSKAEKTARALLRDCEASESTLVKELNARRTPLLLAAVEQRFRGRV